MLLAPGPGDGVRRDPARGMRDPSAADQLAGFLAKFTPEVAARAQAILQKMRARLPGARELVYDNYNALAIGFGPTDRASDAVFSIAVFPRWVSLFFLRAVGLSDPQKLLRGSGKVARHIVLDEPTALDRPAVKALMAQALTRAPKRFDPSQRSVLLIKSVSAKQRPRRPTRSGEGAARPPRSTGSKR